MTRHHVRGKTSSQWLVKAALILGMTTFSMSSSADHTSEPDGVILVGDLQSELGCAGDWDPGCAETPLQPAPQDGVYRGEYILNESSLESDDGVWNYKVALNGGWAENYGEGAAQDGANLKLPLEETTTLTFYYSHKSHWITDNVSSKIATAAGNFQTHLGCPSDWAPDCLRSWLQDLDGDGIYTFTTTEIPPGDYEAKVTINENWDESYGDNGSNVPFSITEPGEEITFTYNSLDNSVVIGDVVSSGDLTTSKAHWLNRETIAWAVPTASMVQLHFDAEAGLASSTDGVIGGTSLSLTYQAGGMSDELKAKFPHLAQVPVFKLNAADLEQVPTIVKQQVAVSASNEDGSLIDATGLQMPGVLDDLFTYAGALGPVYEGDVPTVKVWAPTAKSVSLMLYADATTTEATALPMTLDATTGVWSITGDGRWDRQYYRFQVEVYSPYTQEIVTNLTTDPYTLSASIDGQRSQLVNLNDSDLKPEGWDDLAKPAFTNPEDLVLYELHIRDFSVSDPEVPEELQGKFKAFTVEDSLGMTHLKSLAEVGLSHVHLLPAFDCATIPEDPADRATLQDDLSVYAPDGTEQQAAINEIRSNDAFNWCYDPHHYTVPEGSYATDAQGTTRILEFREMVQALSNNGLRVVMDVVYNHTSQSGQGAKAVLDKVVPGYYHRLNAEGAIERSTCCENTATEHNMMEKLMLDSLQTWAQFYKVDGFRFDLMGHHSKANMLKAQEHLASLTVEEHGVNGESIYLYGEGWNFGEVANDARFEQATQLNMAGTGIGTFNDRFRDAVRGGSPFDSGIGHVETQSFINGLYYDPNAENTGDTGELEQLLTMTDRIRIGLTGNLADYEFTDWQGNSVTGDYGANVGYTSDPQETINYIEAHDNETLFDSNQYKIPLDRDLDVRVRVHNLGTSLVLMAQGVPFLHAGQEIMRSKSGDRNSYDSGDWFNLLDYSYQDNGWARGLPLAQDNQQNWDVLAPRLADATLAVGETEILRALTHTREMLAIRQSSKLFRLETGEAIQNQVSFFNTGLEQKPGLIAMHIADDDSDLDPEREAIMVMINANDEAQELTQADWQDAAFELHPVQKDSADSIVTEASFDAGTGTFSIPARTTAVFQLAQQAPVDDGDDVEDGDDVDNGEGSQAPTENSGSGSASIGLLGLLLILSTGLRQANLRKR